MVSVTTGETVDIWDRLRSSPIHSFDWSSNAVYTARFNPAEHNLIGASGADNVVGLFGGWFHVMFDLIISFVDLRTSSSIQKVFMKLRTNALCWNPMSPLNFTIANEDHNLYTFDMRKLEAAIMVHKDFTAPVWVWWNSHRWIIFSNFELFQIMSLDLMSIILQRDVNLLRGPTIAQFAFSKLIVPEVEKFIMDVACKCNIIIFHFSLFFVPFFIIWLWFLSSEF